MKQLEKRDRMITYCDYCKKEIEPPYHSFEYKDGLRVDLCSTIKNMDEKTCKDKYVYEERFKPKN